MKKFLLPFLILFLAGMGFAAATPTEDLRGPDTIITSVVFDLPPEPEPSIDVSVLSATLKKKNALENMLLHSNVLRSRFKRALHLACAEKLGSDGDKAKAAAETFFVDDIALLSGNGKNEFR